MHEEGSWTRRAFTVITAEAVELVSILRKTRAVLVLSDRGAGEHRHATRFTPSSLDGAEQTLPCFRRITGPREVDPGQTGKRRRRLHGLHPDRDQSLALDPCRGLRHHRCRPDIGWRNYRDDLLRAGEHGLQLRDKVSAGGEIPLLQSGRVTRVLQLPRDPLGPMPVRCGVTEEEVHPVVHVAPVRPEVKHIGASRIFSLTQSSEYYRVSSLLGSSKPHGHGVDGTVDDCRRDCCQSHPIGGFRILPVWMAFCADVSGSSVRCGGTGAWCGTDSG